MAALTKKSVWLVGHDLTEHADHVAQVAAEELRARGEGLILLHAYNLPLPPTYTNLGISMADYPVELERMIEEKAMRRLHELADKLHQEQPELSVETLVLAGDPARTLLEVADARRVSRIVVGTHGRVGLQHFLLGSVAERVVRLAKVPVLVEKRIEQEPDTDEG